MIILEPKKNASQIIQASLSSDNPEKQGDAEILNVAHDILEAVKGGSAHDLAMALKAFLAECEGSEQEAE